jgi:hypothetical protein
MCEVGLTASHQKHYFVNEVCLGRYYPKDIIENRTLVVIEFCFEDTMFGTTAK